MDILQSRGGVVPPAPLRALLRPLVIFDKLFVTWLEPETLLPVIQNIPTEVLRVTAGPAFLNLTPFSVRTTWPTRSPCSTTLFSIYFSAGAFWWSQL